MYLISSISIKHSNGFKNKKKWFLGIVQHIQVKSTDV